MQQLKHFLSFLLICCTALIACPQSTITNKPANNISFHASTPADSLIMSMITTKKYSNLDFIKWKLTLDSNSSANHFTLDVTFGESQPNTQGFKNGGTKLSFSGEYYVLHSNRLNFTGDIYRLESKQLADDIYLGKVNENLLQLITEDKVPMIGNGGWSYTLNRIDPVSTASVIFIGKEFDYMHAPTPSDTFAVFQGRTPCSNGLMKANGHATKDCNRMKWHLTFLQDKETGNPSTYKLKAIYVGNTGPVIDTQGKWISISARYNGEEAIVYQLSPEGSKAGEALYLINLSNGLLFFFDNDRHLLIGDDKHSFTLNQVGFVDSPGR